ncbi:O-antigen translocase [Bacteroides sp.]
MQDKKDISSYRKIVKGTVLFGGVQVITMFVNLVRGKLIAVILGPEGMGISALLTTSANTIQQFSSLGLNFSVVKDISRFKEEEDCSQIAIIISVFRKLLHITSFVGSIISILFSRYLSIWAFGNTAYRYHFIFLSIMIYFTTLSNGEVSILQGVRMLRKLALSSVIGAMCGLLVSIPLYYLCGYDGIVPAMIALSFVTFAFNRYFTTKIDIPKVKVGLRQVRMLGKVMITLGIVMMMAILLGNLSSYLLSAFIRNYGTLSDVGLYQAANSITNQYVGLIFAAMGVEFFPRLSGVSGDNIKVRILVNQQSEMVLLIVAPLAILLILTAPVLIKILLSDDFLPLVSVIRWMGVGILFKAISYPMGYISFSKGDKKVFFWLDGVFGNVLTLIINILFYYYWGLVGIGISFVVSYIVFMLTYIVLTRWRYGFYHSRCFVNMFVVLVLLLGLAFGFSLISNIYVSYTCMGGTFLLCSLFSLHRLNKRIQFFNK